MAKKKKTPPKEYIPAGMSKKDYADAAFRKKVTIIMGSILMVFIVGVIGVLINAWFQTEKHNKEFEARQQEFIAESDAISAQLKAAKTAEDKAAVQIIIDDDNFSEWISVLDNSYKLNKSDEGYAAFEGASVKLQGVFVTKKFGEDDKYTQYWVQRYHSHGEEDHEDHQHDEAIPIEVIFDEIKYTVPEDDTWVEVTGIVGIDSTKNLSAVRNAVVTVMDESGNAHID